MEKQLTAVEWLHEQFKAGFNYNIEEGYEKQRDLLFEQAKEIEHAQHQLLKTQTHLATKKEAQRLVSKYGTEIAPEVVNEIINCECLHYPEDRLYWKSVKKELELM
jgi:hypothetical protein